MTETVNLWQLIIAAIGLLAGALWHHTMIMTRINTLEIKQKMHEVQSTKIEDKLDKLIAEIHALSDAIIRFETRSEKKT